MSAHLAAVRADIGAHMDAILENFVKGSKITVLVRQPSHPDGSRDFVMTDDTLADVIRALEIRKSAEG